MTLAEFECVKKLASNPYAKMKAHDFKISDLSEDGLMGHVHTKEVDADFKYNAEATTLVLADEKKHGLYHAVSDDTIGSHLSKILGGLSCSESSSTQVAETNSVPSTTARTGTPTSPLGQFVKPIITQT